MTAPLTRFSEPRLNEESPDEFHTMRWPFLLALVIGLLYFHSGEILMVLLLPYFAVLHLLERRGMDIVRQETGSAAATAVFGAILLAGFCLVIFPVT